MGSCYFCGEVSDGYEHVPPKCLFPKIGELDGNFINYRLNLITVPSCAKHNTEKSGDDQYLWYVLLCNLPVNGVATEIAKGRLLRAIERRPALINAFLKDATPALVQDPNDGHIFKSIALTVDFNRLTHIFQHVAKGIYFHHFGVRWGHDVSVMPSFISVLGGVGEEEINANMALINSLQESLFMGTKEYGNSPDVFKYQIARVENEENVHCAARLTFYGGCKVIVVFSR